MTPDWLRDGSLTYKDRLVRLVAEQLGTPDPKTIASALDMTTASAKKSLEKTPGAKPPSRRDAIADAIIDACLIDRRSMRDKDWSHLMSVASSLDDAGVDPAEIPERARNLRHRFRIPVTPGSLDKYWPQLAPRERFSPAEILGA